MSSELESIEAGTRDIAPLLLAAAALERIAVSARRAAEAARLRTTYEAPEGYRLAVRAPQSTRAIQHHIRSTGSSGTAYEWASYRDFAADAPPPGDWIAGELLYGTPEGFTLDGKDEQGRPVRVTINPSTDLDLRLVPEDQVEAGFRYFPSHKTEPATD